MKLWKQSVLVSRYTGRTFTYAGEQVQFFFLPWVPSFLAQIVAFLFIRSSYQRVVTGTQAAQPGVQGGSK